MSSNARLTNQGSTAAQEPTTDGTGLNQSSAEQTTTQRETIPQDTTSLTTDQSEGTIIPTGTQSPMVSIAGDISSQTRSHGATSVTDPRYISKIQFKKHISLWLIWGSFSYLPYFHIFPNVERDIVLLLSFFNWHFSLHYCHCTFCSNIYVNISHKIWNVWIIDIFFCETFKLYQCHLWDKSCIPCNRETRHYNEIHWTWLH